MQTPWMPSRNRYRAHVRGCVRSHRCRAAVTRRAGQDEVELPGQIGGVAQARAHALPRERRHLVRGVAGEQQPPASPRVHPARLEAIDGVPLEAGVFRRHLPRSQQAPGGLGAVQFVEILARQAHELPASPPGPARDQRRRAERIADLDVQRTPHLRHMRQHVDDQPIEEEAEVGDGRPERAADEAVGAVAADHVARDRFVTYAPRRHASEPRYTASDHIASSAGNAVRSCSTHAAPAPKRRRGPVARTCWRPASRRGRPPCSNRKSVAPAAFRHS